MAAPAMVAEQSKAEPVGHVVVTVVLANNFDVAAGGRVRSLVLRDALMDTGATYLSLPAPIIAELGLPFAGVLPVETPIGLAELRLFQGALVSFQDREARVDVLELEEGRDPLFGVIPMELLGIEPNTREQTVRVFPLGEGGRSYVHV